MMLDLLFRYYLTVVLSAVMVLVVGGLTPAADVSKLNYDCIKKDMPLYEVERIIGRKSMTEPICFGFNGKLIIRTEWFVVNEGGDKVEVVIEFDYEYKVLNKTRAIVSPASFSERWRVLMSRLGY